MRVARFLFFLVLVSRSSLSASQGVDSVRERARIGYSRGDSPRFLKRGYLARSPGRDMSCPGVRITLFEPVPRLRLLGPMRRRLPGCSRSVGSFAVNETVATVIVLVFGVYVLIGVVFAVYFVTKGCNQIDPNARDGSRGFRVLIFPGAAALWPLLLRRLLQGQTQPPTETNAHRERAGGVS